MTDIPHITYIIKKIAHEAHNERNYPAIIPSSKPTIDMFNM